MTKNTSLWNEPLNFNDLLKLMISNHFEIGSKTASNSTVQFMKYIPYLHTFPHAQSK